MQRSPDEVWEWTLSLVTKAIAKQAVPSWDTSHRPLQMPAHVRGGNTGRVTELPAESLLEVAGGGWGWGCSLHSLEATQQDTGWAAAEEQLSRTQGHSCFQVPSPRSHLTLSTLQQNTESQQPNPHEPDSPGPPTSLAVALVVPRGAGDGWLAFAFFFSPLEFSKCHHPTS